MHLSRLTLNPRHRQARQDLAAPYELHRTLLRAFPDREDGGPGRVLFRIEPSSTDGQPIVLVQSQVEPNWDELQDGYLTGCAQKQVELDLQKGQCLRFRLRANPTVTREGKRHGLFQIDQQLEWLRRKGERNGFEPFDVMVGRADRQTTRPGNSRRPPLVHWSVDYEGKLRITDPGRLLGVVRDGIGPAKAFGFGLLSLAPT